MKHFCFYLFILILSISGCKDKNANAKRDIVEGQALINKTTKPDSIYYISAASGLKYRIAPKSKSLGKFPLNEKVTLVKRTGNFEDIKDGEKVIHGEWVGVKKGKDTVYVFDGFLSETKTIFNKETTEAIVDYYNKNFGGNGIEIKESITKTTKTLSYNKTPKYEDGYSMRLMTVEIPRKLNNNHVYFGDLNKDGVKDIIIPVYTEGGGGGGNVWWVDLFVFFKRENGYEFIVRKTNWEISGCKNNGFININKEMTIKDNLISSISSCYDEEDGRCCPSLIYDVKLKILNHDFVVTDTIFKSKKD